MTPRRTLVFWPVLLAALSAVLAWSVYSELTAAPGSGAWSIYGHLRTPPTPGSRTLPLAPAPIAPVPPLAEFSLPAIETFTDVLARPMFSTTRRPPTKEAVAAAVVPDPSLDLTLRGVILSATERIALIVPAARSETVRIRENEQFEGWTLVVVEADFVVFRQGIEELTFEMSFDAPIPEPQRVRPRRRQPRRQPGQLPGQLPGVAPGSAP